MVNYIYLGYGVTDSNGVAKLDHDANGDPISHSYTGTGAGEIDIVASLDNPIGEGSIQSEIYSLLDTLFFDEGILTNHRSDYTSNNINASYDETGTTLTPLVSDSSTTYTLNQTVLDNTIIEFDFKINTRNGNNIRFFVGGVNLYYTTAEMGDNQFHHFKAIVDSTSVTATVDDVSVGDGTRTSNTAIRFILANNCVITFKNLKIYPI